MLPPLRTICFCNIPLLIDFPGVMCLLGKCKYLPRYLAQCLHCFRNCLEVGFLISIIMFIFILSLLAKYSDSKLLPACSYFAGNRLVIGCLFFMARLQCYMIKRSSIITSCDSAPGLRMGVH